MDINNSNLVNCQLIKASLYESLSQISDFSHCCLLDFPSYPNLGDHLIWLGNLYYLSKFRGARIDYVCDANRKNFKTNITNLLAKSKDGPIFLSGGGNFGDLWTRSHDFRKQIINTCHNRAIVVLPQTIYFSQEKALDESAIIFNQHPNITIFARDKISFDTAKQAFSECKVYMAPDMAFAMADLPKINISVPKKKDRILYIFRRDKEVDNEFNPSKLNIDNLDVDDWVSYNWLRINPAHWIYIPGFIHIFREGWQRGLKTPQEFISRQKWKWFSPHSPIFSQVDHPFLSQISWGYMHSAIYQLKAYDMVITNRLHVHILCILLNIPHIVIPGSYFKIESFYNTWTFSVPFCRLVKDIEEIPLAIKQLKEYCTDK